MKNKLSKAQTDMKLSYELDYNLSPISHYYLLLYG